MLKCNVYLIFQTKRYPQERIRKLQGDAKGHFHFWPFVCYEAWTISVCSYPTNSFDFVLDIARVTAWSMDFNSTLDIVRKMMVNGTMRLFFTTTRKIIPGQISFFKVSFFKVISFLENILKKWLLWEREQQ